MRLPLVLSFMLSVFALAGCRSGEVRKSAENQPAKAAPVLPATLEDAIVSEFRDPENRKRDPHRHPLETLQFFGIMPGMTVVEITPGAGWYMEILAPFLASRGRYIAALPPSEGNEYLAKLNNRVRSWMDRYPEVGSKVTMAVFNPASGSEIAPAGTADMVLTFRNVHNWMSNGVSEQAFETFFKALKPGGILGVVEHRASPRGAQDPQAKSGYVQERTVIAMATKAGFKLDSKSEINANPKDTKNYPDGVWTLPPTLRLGDKDRERYLGIGESDRMTLKFVKPM